MSKIGTLSTTMAVAAAALMSAAPAQSAPIDLSSWTPLTLNFPANQGAGNWVLEPGNTAVKQTINADPSFFLNGLNQTGYRMQGSWQVQESGGDDDFMGFAFGYQNSSNFYLFDWKQTSQSSSPAFAAEGMTIKKYDGAGSNGLTDLSISEFWENEHALGDMSVLATNHSSTAGWVDHALYDFLLEYNLVPGQFRVKVSQGATTLWDVNVADGTFGAGQFGFFTNSQAAVRYAGFEQQVIPPDPDPIPEPASLALFGLALAGAAARYRQRSASER
jgi:hypothetical protein